MKATFLANFKNFKPSENKLEFESCVIEAYQSNKISFCKGLKIQKYKLVIPCELINIFEHIFYIIKNP